MLLTGRDPRPAPRIGDLPPSSRHHAKFSRCCARCGAPSRRAAGPPARMARQRLTTTGDDIQRPRVRAGAVAFDRGSGSFVVECGEPRTGYAMRRVISASWPAAGRYWRLRQARRAALNRQGLLCIYRPLFVSRSQPRYVCSGRSPPTLAAPKPTGAQPQAFRTAAETAAESPTPPTSRSFTFHYLMQRGGLRAVELESGAAPPAPRTS